MERYQYNNRLDVGLFDTNLAIGTTATLYGILKA
jgi:hypothetical protein